MIIGSVPYLNTRPLIQYFLDHPGRTGHRLIYAIPSRLVPMLREGQIDIAIPSAFSLFAVPGLCIVPSAGIVSYGPVLSVRLFTRMPVEALRSVALDTSSLSSVALARILLAERFGLNPAYIAAPPDPEAMLAVADACVLIGDPALRALLAGYESIDLAEEWFALTGLPFVFATWVARCDADLGDLPEVLLAAKRYGQACLPEIAECEAARLGFPPDFCRRYLTESVLFDLNEPEMRGLFRFRELSQKHGIVSDPTPIRVYGQD
ncbi:MAG: menaquinone biosynthesis protein [Armatimonadetes bacterium]|nr:menaquinone biosynthesis protein [Armatimonadota bacterium]